jgi:hypothetical protein
MVEQKIARNAIRMGSWADFRRVLHRFLSRNRLEVSWGQVWRENGREPTKTKINILVSDYDRY